jgi:hypothetical protein
MQITAVDSDNNLFCVQQVMPDHLVQKVLTMPWLDLPWHRQEGQSLWPRRRIHDAAIPWLDEWNQACSAAWGEIMDFTGSKLNYCGTAFWVDEPGFACSMHTDGEMPGSMQLNWIGTRELGTCFYWYKNPASLRYQTPFEPNSGYIMINQADESGYRPLMWHAMLNPVPANSFRLTSYSVGFA